MAAPALHAEVRDEAHAWTACKCARCGKLRDLEHVWAGCRCKHCGKVRDQGHDWDGPVCKTCRKQLIYTFGSQIYVGNQIAQLMLSLTKSVMTHSISPAEGVIAAFDLVEKLPPRIGWDLLKQLLYVCTPRVYIVPLYRNMKSQPEIYAAFAKFMVSDYSLDSQPSYSNEETSPSPEALEAILDCLSDPHEAVSDVARSALRALARSNMHTPANIDDAAAWRAWLAEFTERVERTRELVRKAREEKPKSITP
jgi:hypothetical protein